MSDQKEPLPPLDSMNKGLPSSNVIGRERLIYQEWTKVAAAADRALRKAEKDLREASLVYATAQCLVSLLERERPRAPSSFFNPEFG